MLPLLLLAAAAAPPAPAKPGPVETLHKQVVDAIRNCPVAGPGEITVCARDRGIAEGYRIPRMDPRFAGNALRPSGRGTIVAPDVAASGTGSCTTAGGGGFTGCSLQDYRNWGAWKAQEKAEGRAFPW